MKRVLIVIIVALLLLKTDVFAQEASPAAKITPTPVPYTLPYPGLLPDHPLWFIKAARDRIIGFLIADPLKKAEFNLLQADKRLATGVSLLRKEKGEMAVSTISKGQNYFAQALEKAGEAKRMDKDVTGFIDALFRSSRKHQQVLKELVEKYPSFASGLEKEFKRAQEHEKLAIEQGTQ